MAELKLAVEDVTDQMAWDSLVIDSAIWPVPLANLQIFRRMLVKAKLAVLKDMISLQGQVPMTLRNLNGDDVRRGNNHWNETVTIVENAWQDTVAAAVSIRSNVSLGIFGVADIGIDHAVSGIRIQAGGARQVEWDLQLGFNPFGPMADGPDMSRFYIADSVLVIGQEKGLTIRYYVRGATAVEVQPTELPLIGVIAELEAGGSGLARSTT